MESEYPIESIVEFMDKVYLPKSIADKIKDGREDWTSEELYCHRRYPLEVRDIVLKETKKWSYDRFEYLVYRELRHFCFYWNNDFIHEKNGLLPLTDKELLAHHNSERVLEEVYDIIIRPFKVKASLKCILYEYPDSNSLSSTRYSLMIFHKKGNQESLRHFTLDHTWVFDSQYGIHPSVFTPGWMVGDASDGYRYLGNVSYEITRKNFVEDVLHRFYNTEFKYEDSYLKLNELNYTPTIYLYIISFIISIIGGISIFQEKPLGIISFCLGGLICLLIWQCVFMRDTKRLSDVIFVKHKKVILRWGILYVLGLLLGSLIGILSI